MKSIPKMLISRKNRERERVKFHILYTVYMKMTKKWFHEKLVHASKSKLIWRKNVFRKSADWFHEKIRMNVTLAIKDSMALSVSLILRKIIAIFLAKNEPKWLTKTNSSNVSTNVNLFEKCLIVKTTAPPILSSWILLRHELGYNSKMIRK